jgi:hypothetical protein
MKKGSKIVDFFTLCKFSIRWVSEKKLNPYKLNRTLLLIALFCLFQLTVKWIECDLFNKYKLIEAFMILNPSYTKYFFKYFI